MNAKEFENMLIENGFEFQDFDVSGGSIFTDGEFTFVYEEKKDDE